MYIILCRHLEGNREYLLCIVKRGGESEGKQKREWESERESERNRLRERVREID